MNKNLKLECTCKFHQIVVDYDCFSRFLSRLFGIYIYKHRSVKTGQVLKKPKLIGDVVITDNQMNKIQTFINNAK